MDLNHLFEIADKARAREKLTRADVAVRAGGSRRKSSVGLRITWPARVRHPGGFTVPARRSARLRGRRCSSRAARARAAIRRIRVLHQRGARSRIRHHAFAFSQRLSQRDVLLRAMHAGRPSSPRRERDSVLRLPEDGESGEAGDRRPAVAVRDAAAAGDAGVVLRSGKGRSYGEIARGRSRARRRRPPVSGCLRRHAPSPRVSPESGASTSARWPRRRRGVRLRGARPGGEIVKAGQDRVEQPCDAGRHRRVVVLHRERGVDGAAAFVAEHDEERRLADACRHTETSRSPPPRSRCRRPAR